MSYYEIRYSTSNNQLAKAFRGCTCMKADNS